MTTETGGMFLHGCTSHVVGETHEPIDEIGARRDQALVLQGAASDHSLTVGTEAISINRFPIVVTNLPDTIRTVAPVAAV